MKEGIPTSHTQYFQNLDGWRFLAFFTVFVSHAALFLGYENTTKTFDVLKKYVLVSGDVGVSFFFVLSGFLITFLLLKERQKTGRISLKKFYIRRMLRIWPVYFMTLIVGFFVLPLLRHALIGTATLPFLATPPLHVLPKYLFFLANFSLAFHGGASVPTDILWSISVEEQFYLVWPWILTLVPERHLAKVLGLILVIAGVYRFANASHYDVVAYSTFSVMSDLAIGCSLALAFVHKSRLLAWVKSKARILTLPLYIVAIAIIALRHELWSKLATAPTAYALSMALVPLALTLLFAFIIFEQNESFFSLFKAGNSRFLVSLGKISYGLYAYHMIAFTLVMIVALKLHLLVFYHSFFVWILFALVSLGITIVIALTSYNFVEKKFLSKKPS